jgi:hypothetical protein
VFEEVVIFSEFCIGSEEFFVLFPEFQELQFFIFNNLFKVTSVFFILGTVIELLIHFHFLHKLAFEDFIDVGQ